MSSILEKYICPVCKESTRQKHCKSPTCGWFICVKHPAPSPVSRVIFAPFSSESRFFCDKEKLMEIRTRPVGFNEKIDNFQDRIPEYDFRSGSHFWIVILVHRVDPEKLKEKEGIFDHETLMSVSVPGCYYCESVYTPLLASRRCKGHP